MKEKAPELPSTPLGSEPAADLPPPFMTASSLPWLFNLAGSSSPPTTSNSRR